MKTVAIYIRVSTEEQAREGYSLDNQREELVRYAERQGYAVHAVYKDTASGYTLNRPSLNRLRDDATNGKFSAVIVWKIDRFSRNLRNLLNLIEELSAVGIGFVSATESFDTTNAAGKLQLHVLSSVAQFERDRIIERVRPGMEQGVRRGHWQGARYAPFGYRYDKQQKKLVIVPEEAEIVREIFRRYLDGQSTPQLVRSLSADGYRPRGGTKFYTKFLSTVLKSEIYIGRIVWGKKHYIRRLNGTLHYTWVPSEAWIHGMGSHEAIIDDDTFRRCQARIASMRNAPVSFVRSGSSEYILTGVLKCAYCGSGMIGNRVISNRRTGIKKRRYLCGLYNSQGGPHDCRGQSIYAEDVEPLAIAAVKKVESDKAVLRRIRKAVIEGMGTQTSESKVDLIYLSTQLEEVQRKRDKLLHDKLDGIIDSDQFKRVNAGLYDQERRLYRQVRGLQRRIMASEHTSFDIESVLSTLADFEGLFPLLQQTKRKLVVHAVIESIIVKEGKVTSMKYNEPFRSILLEEKVLSEKETSHLY